LLLELKVKDLGIIEDIDWKLDTGLNIITGETGAGKSLVIDAVELLLTGTAGEEVVRRGASAACIEGIFAISDDERFIPLKSFLSDKDLNSEEDILVLTCEVRKQKSGLVRINGHTVTKAVFRQIGQLLIDIHGQSEHLSLLDKKYHLDFLDAYAHTQGLRNQFSAKVESLRDIEAEINALKNQQKDTSRQEEFLKYQIDEIKKAKLQNNEDEELEKERRLISYSEKLKEYSQIVNLSLFESESSRYSASALTKLNEAVQAMKKLVDLDPALNQQLDYLEKTVFGLEEVARDVRIYAEKLEYDPRRLEEIEARLELIRNLKRKYGKTIPDILEYLAKSQKELEGIGMSSEKQSQLELQQTVLKKELWQLASELSCKRSQAALRLNLAVRKELQDLEMSQMLFEVSITQSVSSDGIGEIDSRLYSFTSDGIDNVEFLVSTNPGEPLNPLARIASTGEISRFTLALKGALSEADRIPVLIFDEVDIGIGGRSGDIIGKKLWSLSHHHQVICVTHLPQIAVYADAHYYIHKSLVDGRTVSTLDNLEADLRLNEIALMLAGPGYSETALKNARELIEKAELFKKYP
jgi:DNA repair protein RecN (Recombination protein N)